MNKERILITGSDGMLGSYFNFGMRMNHHDFDVTNLQSIMTQCLERRPSVIVHMAALTDLSVCEQEPSRAHLVNSVGTYHVALAARAVDAKLVYISTSGVFDGIKNNPYVESDIPNPINVYGHSKYLGECAVSGMLDDYLIVRTSWLFGGGPLRDKKFIGKILAQGDTHTIRAVTDRQGSPTYAKDLAQAVVGLIDEDKRGAVHLGGGVATRYEIAKELISIVGSKVSIESAVSADFLSSYVSGKNESMIASPYMRPWQEALKDYVDTEWRSAKQKHI